MEKIKNNLAEKLGRTLRRGMDIVARTTKEETGSSELVVVVILIIIVLAVAAIFKDRLTTVVEAVFRKVLGWVNG